MMCCGAQEGRIAVDGPQGDGGIRGGAIKVFLSCLTPFSVHFSDLPVLNGNDTLVAMQCALGQEIVSDPNFVACCF